MAVNKYEDFISYWKNTRKTCFAIDILRSCEESVRCLANQLSYFCDCDDNLKKQMAEIIFDIDNLTENKLRIIESRQRLLALHRDILNGFKSPSTNATRQEFTHLRISAQLGAFEGWSPIEREILISSDDCAEIIDDIIQKIYPRETHVFETVTL